MRSIILKRALLIVGGAVALVVPAIGPAETGTGTGWFIEAGIKQVDASRTVNDFVIDDQQSGWSFGVGYAFTRNVSLLAGYLDLGDAHFATDCPPPNLCLVENPDRVDITGYAASVLGRWPVTELFDVYGKVGVISWDTDFQRFARDESEQDLLVGIGFGVAILPNWRVALEYEDYGFDVDSANLVLTYRFGR